MRRHITIAALTAIVFMTATAQEPTVVTGYLIDAMCSSYIVKKGPAEAMVKAAKHTRECCLDAECAKHGFGIVSEGKFIKLDANGDLKAKDFLTKVKREDNILVEVRGIIQGGTLSVESLKAARPAAALPAKKM